MSLYNTNIESEVDITEVVAAEEDDEVDTV